MYTSTPFARMYNSRSTHALARTHEHTQNIFTHSPTYTHAPTLSLSLTGTSRRMAQLCPPGRHTAPYPASLRRPHPRRTTANTRRDKVSGGRWARGSRGDGDHGGALERILRARSGFSGWISGCVARTVSVSLSRSLCMYISKSCAQHGLFHICTHPHTHTPAHTHRSQRTRAGECGSAVLLADRARQAAAAQSLLALFFFRACVGGHLEVLLYPVYHTDILIFCYTQTHTHTRTHTHTHSLSLSLSHTHTHSLVLSHSLPLSLSLSLSLPPSLPPSLHRSKRKNACAQKWRR